MSDERKESLTAWLNTVLPAGFTIAPIVGDASFRRYFRVMSSAQTYIAMDSPPEKEDCKSFVVLAKAFREAGLNTPVIYFADEAAGFLLLSDFGDALYHANLTSANAAHLYGVAIEALHQLQNHRSDVIDVLPHFDWQHMLTELNFFEEWFLKKYLHLSLSSAQEKILQETFERLLESATQQPQVCIHRDYHSRNLMILPQDQVGILDFQDAMIGPITYDLVSLIRDCYVDWPREQVNEWALDFYARLIQSGQMKSVDQQTFLRWFDWMGMQRHLKAIFIFARKSLRDGNDFYLQFIPRTLHYVSQVSGHYDALRPFYNFLNEVIMPAWAEKEVA